MKLISSILFLLMSAPAHAFEWSDLWLNDHQKAQKLLKENPAAAAETFPETEWQGIAKYNAGDFSAAAEKFNEVDNLASEYNLGNALAKAGELERSLESYESLLEQPNLATKLREDAVFNRDLVKKLLKQQESQQPEENSEDQNESGENQESQDSGQQGQEGQDQSDAEQSESEQSEGESSDESQNQQQSAQDEEQESDNQQSESRDEKSEQDEQAASANQQAQDNKDEPMTEDQQATEQWLRQIPDDPSGLLRRKLVQSHRTKYPQVQNGGQAW